MPLLDLTTISVCITAYSRNILNSNTRSKYLAVQSVKLDFRFGPQPALTLQGLAGSDSQTVLVSNACVSEIKLCRLVKITVVLEKEISLSYKPHTVQF